ncbi:MAG: GNAT family N-acetyltransferase [Rhodovarius sp.]|nr:GNAT family N-acetyltransferase [Rhodovarius sp.]
MDQPPREAPPPLPAGAMLLAVPDCTVPFYRYLYNTVGQDYVWWLRRTLTDRQLAEILAHPGLSVHVLWLKGEPAGFFELDRARAPVTNLAYFGLMPWAIGRGLGFLLLRHAIATAWAEGCAALTVNTCTADHPRALPNYLRAGFRRVRVVREDWPVPAALGLPIPPRLKVG